MPADMRTAIGDLRGTRERKLQQPRSHIIPHDHPSRIGPFFVVEGVLAGGDFTVPGEAVAMGFDQNDVARVGAGEAGLEEVHQGHADLAERDAV